MISDLIIFALSLVGCYGFYFGLAKYLDMSVDHYLAQTAGPRQLEMFWRKDYYSKKSKGGRKWI